MFEIANPPPSLPGRVVVLGARGVIGKALTAALTREKLAHLALASGDLDLLAEGTARALAARLRPDDALVVLAALTPDKGRDPATLLKNLRMAETVCAAIRDAPCRHVTYMSSDAVYPFASGLISEESPAAPADLYGVMHRAREIMFAETCGGKIPLAVLRCTMILAADDTHNSYGPNRFRRQARADGKIVLGGGGEETRDHVLVDDAARLVLETVRLRGFGILNIASGVSHSFREVAEMVAAFLTPHPEILSTERCAPITHRHFDSTLLRRNFPSFRFTPLAEAIADTHRSLGLYG